MCTHFLGISKKGFFQVRFDRCVTGTSFASLVRLGIGPDDMIRLPWCIAPDDMLFWVRYKKTNVRNKIFPIWFFKCGWTFSDGIDSAAGGQASRCMLLCLQDIGGAIHSATFIKVMASGLGLLYLVWGYAIWFEVTPFGLTLRHLVWGCDIWFRWHLFYLNIYFNLYLTWK